MFFCQNVPKTEEEASDNGGDASTDNQVEEGNNTQTKGDNSCVDSSKADNCNEPDSSKRDDSGYSGGKGDNCEDCENAVSSSDTSDCQSALSCVPMLTYLDEACSRWRINNFGLTLKQTENGGLLFQTLWDLADAHKKERLCRILTDIESGKIVTRAESTKELVADSVPS